MRGDGDKKVGRSQAFRTGAEMYYGWKVIMIDEGERGSVNVSMSFAVAFGIYSALRTLMAE